MTKYELPFFCMCTNKKSSYNARLKQGLFLLFKKLHMLRKTSTFFLSIIFSLLSSPCSLNAQKDNLPP